MSFSSRFHWDSRPNPLTALLREKRNAQASGAPAVLDLTESNPTRAGLNYPEEEIVAALANLSYVALRSGSARHARGAPGSLPLLCGARNET